MGRTQRITETRVSLLYALSGQDGEAPVRAAVADELHRFVAGMTLDNVLVRLNRVVGERSTVLPGTH
jgi:hypothetical protein